MKKALLLAVAIMLVVAGTAMAGVVGSKHDLSTGGSKVQTNASQVCVFCHTPHGANTAVPGLLWNRNIGTYSFSTYVNTVTDSFDGSTTILGTPDQVTVLCFSCHDGTLSILTLTNPPNELGATAVAETTSFLDADGSMDNASPAAIGADDLKNDHPVGFEYETARAADGTENSFPVGSTGTVTGALSGNTYPLQGANLLMTCATCHGVHMGGTDSKTTGIDFMRGDTFKSEICLDCHTTK